VPSNANVRALQAAQPRAHNSAADEPASRHVFGQRIHTSTQSSSLAPRRRTRLQPISIHGRPLAEGRLGRKGGWGGREHGAEGRLGWKRRQGRTGVWGGREAGADGSMGRKRAWGGREPGAVRAEASMGRKRVWGGSEYGAEGSMGRKAHPDTPTSTLTLKLRHFSARREASTLFRRGGEFGKMFPI
jgi:hypothetical protein